MVKNIELEQLIINKLTQAQYDALAVKNPGELYFITDATPTKEIETQLAELSKKVPEPISTYESFPEATAENVGLRVVYTGETIEAPSIENENSSVPTVFLDPYLTRGHTFMLVPVELSLDTEPTTVYMWQDVNGAIPPISDDTSGKMLSNNGITYEWTEVVLGEKLPDQTDNAGKFLTTDGTTASWSDKPLVNNADNESSNPYRRLSIGGNSNLSTATYYTAVGNGAYVSGDGGIAIGGTFNEPGGYNYEAYATRAVGISAISIGISSKANAYNCIAIGYNAYVNGSKSIAIGSHAEATATNAIAIGGYSGGKARAQATAECAIQLGCGTDPGQDCTNSDANTLKVANNNGNFEMMDANGNVPLDRLTYVTDQIGDISTALTSILGE